MQNQGKNKSKKINWDKYLPKKETAQKKKGQKGTKSTKPTYATGKKVEKTNKTTNKMTNKTTNKMTNKTTNKMANKPTNKTIKKSQEKTLELYYMTQKEITVKQLLEKVEQDANTVVQIWDEIGVGSIEFGETESVDFIMCNDVFEFEEDLEFLKKHAIKTSFEVSLEDKNKNAAAKWFLAIIEQHGGFFCTDSDDFTPVYDAKDLMQWK